MPRVRDALWNIWRKNWPEVRAAFTGGLPQFIAARHARDLGSNIPVFSYHVVSAKDFEADLDFLSQNGYITIHADLLLDHLEGRRAAPQRAVVLTFDDGARNLYEVVFPLLQHFGMNAVAFISPGLHREDSEGFTSRPKKGLPPPLSWSQIREMHASGAIDFQSHTYEHRYVPRWPEPADLEGSDPDAVRPLRGPARTVAEDFRLARETLEQKLGKAVYHLAFPMYNGTREAVQIAKECGYRAFWWGVLPYRPNNGAGQSPSHIVRVDGRYLRRLPGAGRRALNRILLDRYSATALRLIKVGR